MINIGRHFKGRNFMTPDIINYGESGSYIYELSSGRNICGTSLMYGVTVKQCNGDSTELGRKCDTKQEALDYIRTLGSI